MTRVSTSSPTATPTPGATSPPGVDADSTGAPPARDTLAPPAIVVGRGVTALGIVRSLGRVGIPAFVLGPSDDLSRQSRWSRPVPGVGDDADERPLAELLSEAELDAGVLVPGSDSAVREIARLPVALAARFPASVPPLSALDVLIDKRAFAAFLREHELPHPRTIELDGGEGLDSVEDEIFSRAFLKPRESQRFFRHFRVKGIRVESREDARRRLREIEAAGLSAVLQEYVPGPPTSHVFLDGFVDRHGELSHLLTRRRTRMYPEDFGNSTLCETVPPAEVAAAVTALRHLLDALSYRGIFSAEVKMDERDGIYRFLEVNARAWWYVEFAARCGVNVCEAAYLDAQERPVRAPAPPPAGVRLVHPSLDFDAFRSLRAEPERERLSSPAAASSAWSWFRPWIGARQAILVADDPWPAVWSAKCRIGRRLRARAGGQR